MVAIPAISSFISVAPHAVDAKCGKPCSDHASFGGKVPKSAPPSGAVHVKANAQAHAKVNGSAVTLTSPKDAVKKEDETPSSSPRTFINQLPDWSMLLAAITTIFLAAEKQWMMLDWKPRRPDMLSYPFGIGKIVQDSLVFRQNFSIRSYEIGADRTASIETLMNHLQETAINHVKSVGLLSDGFATTPEMCKRNLIWVVTRMQVLVEHYPKWGDDVQIDTWVSSSGRNGMRRDWLVHDGKTGETLTRASSQWVMMNKITRKLSKMPEEVKGEIKPHFLDSDPVVEEEDGKKLSKLDDNTADYIRKGLFSRWNDLDVNQHVNNVKYIGWILESAPPMVLENHELSALTLEYRRECGKDSVLQSLTALSGSGIGTLGKPTEVECQHLLRLENGAEVVRGRTVWKPKYANFIPAASSQFPTSAT